MHQCNQYYLKKNITRFRIYIFEINLTICSLFRSENYPFNINLISVLLLLFLSQAECFLKKNILTYDVKR